MATEKYITPAYLISEAVSDRYDEVGNPVRDEVRTKKLVALLNTTTNEWYKARSFGYRNVKSVKIREFDYKGQQKVEIEGITYDVYRTSDPEDGAMILYLRDHVIKKDAIE